MVDGERIAADDTAEKLGLEDAVREWGRSHPESTVFIETCFMFRFRFQK